MLVGLLWASAVILYGCQQTADSRTTSSGRPLDQTRRPIGSVIVGSSEPGAGQSAVEPVQTFVDARPAALIDGRPLLWGELRPMLNELAGAEALQEALLDRKLAEELRKANVVIGEGEISAEARLLTEGLHPDPDTALRLLDELRQRQRLGRIRYAAMLKRNAGLRALARDSVVINDHALETMHDVLHGPKRQARIIVVRDLPAAHAALSRLAAGDAFADVATLLSIDTSAGRGGLLEPISRLDRAYPEALRQALWRLEANQISDPVLVDDQFAIIMLERIVKGDGKTLQEDRENLVRQVRLQQERVLMEQIARRLVGEAAVTVFDDELHESWSRHRKGAGGASGARHGSALP